VAIISGVFSSTILTLFVIPLLYYLYASRKHKKQ
jgi:Cu/Ag efflux pump CusA